MDIKKMYRRIVFLYIRETPNTEEIHNLKESLRNCDCIIGDLNLNPKVPEQRNKLITLCGKTKYMALEEITTINGTQLEHVIIEKEMKKTSFATAYFKFASDHKSIAFRLASYANCFTAAFKQSINFDQDYHTKKKTQRTWKENISNTAFEEDNSTTVRMETINEEPNQKKENVNHLTILLFGNPTRSNLCSSNLFYQTRLTK